MSSCNATNENPAVRFDRCDRCLVEEVEALLAEVKASENRIATIRARIAELSGEVQEKTR